MSGDPQPTVPWQRSRYLSEHWGRTMAAQDDLAIADYRVSVREAVRDLLSAELFGPKTVLLALDRIAGERSAEVRRVASESNRARNARMKANGGCPVCADAEKPDPDNHREFHDRMTASQPQIALPETRYPARLHSHADALERRG